MVREMRALASLDHVAQDRMGDGLAHTQVRQRLSFEIEAQCRDAVAAAGPERGLRQRGLVREASRSMSAALTSPR
jgi:hypothetical protein